MKIGFSSKIITPDLKNRKRPLQLAGYSPRKNCTGIHDEIFARAVYIEGDENDINTHLLMIVCDIVSINSKFASLLKSCADTIPPLNLASNVMFSDMTTSCICHPSRITNTFILPLNVS